MAIELLTPSETFWGVTFRLKVAIDDLLKLEKDMKDSRSGAMAPRVLREFRDAVDYVRKTAWALQELQERQAHQRDVATVRSLLTDERVRRATQLSKALASDLDSHDVTDGTAGAAELFRAIEGLNQRLAGLFRAQASRQPLPDRNAFPSHPTKRNASVVRGSGRNSTTVGFVLACIVLIGLALNAAPTRVKRTPRLRCRAPGRYIPHPWNQDSLGAGRLDWVGIGHWGCHDGHRIVLNCVR